MLVAAQPIDRPAFEAFHLLTSDPNLTRTPVASSFEVYYEVFHCYTGPLFS